MFLCSTSDVSIGFPTIYHHFCFVLLVSRFHWKVRCLFVFFVFKRFSVVSVSWLELGFTDAAVTLIFVILGRRFCIFLVQHVITETLIFKGALGFVHIVTSFCLNWWSWVCHCFIMYIDTWFHVWHTIVANFHIASVERFWKTYGVVESVC